MTVTMPPGATGTIAAPIDGVDNPTARVEGHVVRADSCFAAERCPRPDPDSWS
jgi:hypothetical protein